MIKNIVFDMGNVIIRFDMKAHMQRAGITDGEDQRIVMREVYNSLEWARMDRGSLSDEEAVEIFAARVPGYLSDRVRDAASFWKRPPIMTEGIEELIRELKQNGYRLFILSNASRRLHDLLELTPGHECFDDVLVSADVRIMKPEREMYELCLEKFGIEPEESVLIDDSPANCEAAFNLGINTIVFHGDAGEAREKLAALGVKCGL